MLNALIVTAAPPDDAGLGAPEGSLEAEALGAADPAALGSLDAEAVGAPDAAPGALEPAGLGAPDAAELAAGVTDGAGA